MAKTEDRYIRFYTAGSAAQELAPALRSEAAQSYRPRKNRKMVLYIDPVAILGMVTVLVLTICLFIAVGGYNQAKADYEQMRDYNLYLEERNVELQKIYSESFDREEVRLEAVLMGYVPSSQVQHVTIRAAEPAPVPEEPDRLTQAWNYFVELFA